MSTAVTKQVFRDEWERKAHDVICVLRYGGTGGSIRTDEMRRIADILRGRPFDPPRVKINLSPPAIKVSLPPPPIKIKLPTP